MRANHWQKQVKGHRRKASTMNDKEKRGKQSRNLENCGEKTNDNTCTKATYRS